MREGLGLGLCGGRRCQGGLSLGGRGGGREQGDLLADSSAEVAEGLFDVGRVVVGLGRVLVTDKRRDRQRSLCDSVVGSSRWHPRYSQHLLVDLFQSIDALLKVDVVRRQLGLS